MYRRIQEKLGRLNYEAFGQLEEWASNHEMNASSDDRVFGVFRQSWRDLGLGDARSRVKIIVDHVTAAEVFATGEVLSAGVWCGDLRRVGHENKKEWRKWFSDRLRSLISRRHQTLWSDRRALKPNRPFLVGVKFDVPLQEIVVSEGKFNQIVIAEFERLYPLAALIDEVIWELNEKPIS